jgi:hypothetical protein
MTDSITCPRCQRTSHNPNDVLEGYCGNCHDWTTPKITVMRHPGPVLFYNWHEFVIPAWLHDQLVDSDDPRLHFMAAEMKPVYQREMDEAMERIGEVLA